MSEDEPIVSGEDVALWVDRFTSSSSAQDAVDSLQLIVDAMKKAKAAMPPKSENKDAIFDSRWILDDDSLVEDLISVLQTQQHKGKDMDSDRGDGVSLVCHIFQHISHNVKCLQTPQPGRLLEALLDVASDDKGSYPIYARVAALQVLLDLSRRHSSVTQAQWLQAPNGLHRLADLFASESSPPPEVVRNEALLVAHVLARHTSIAKVWLFAEVETHLLNWCWSEGGLTRGQPVVLDALKLVHQLIQSADANLLDLVWQREPVGPRLAQLMDLRGGVEFLHPDQIKKKVSAKPKLKPSASSEDTDDLDDLMQSGSPKKKSTKPDDSIAPAAAAPPQDDILPSLTSQEEEVINLALRIVQRLLSSDELRPRIWKQHAGFCVLVWELALVSPMRPPVCALPSPKLQQSALELVACYINDPAILDKISGIDRLLYIVCTGGGTATTLEERFGLSQAALHVLRRTLGTERIHEILVFTLAPPPPVEDENAPVADTTTVVQKLWNTIAQNLPTDQAEDQVGLPAVHRQEAIDTRKVILSGAFGGLSIFLQDDTSREMMLRAMPDGVNMDQMLGLLAGVGASSSIGATDVDIPSTILRFLCEWVQDTPLIVQTLLSSNESTHLATLAYHRSSENGTNPAAPAAPTSLVHLLLGLAMESMASHEKDSEEQSKYGGWTRSGILQIITKVGISKFTSSLESLKNLSSGNGQTLLPWMTSELEWNYWREWYRQAVWVVRKRVVEELTGGGDSGDEDEDNGADIARSDRNGFDSAPSSGSGSSLKPLQRLISQQTKEMDGLKEQLADAQAVIASQVDQLDTWKRRAESNPTQLDELLSEMTSKNGMLNEKIKSLEKELSDSQTQHTAEMKAAKESYDALLEERDDTIASQRENIETLTNEKREAEEDRDRAEQDLQNLSHAYTSLEAEYQLSQAQQATVQPAALAESGEDNVAVSSDDPPAGLALNTNSEEDVSTLQQEPVQDGTYTVAENNGDGDDVGSIGAIVSSEEIASLREEIERLRHDAQNADEWMANAVNQMNGMGAHNANLESQVASFRQQVGHLQAEVQNLSATSQTATNSLAEVERLQLLLETATHREEELRIQLSAASQQQDQESQARHTQLATEEQRNADLLEQLSIARRDAQQAIDSMAEMKAHQEKLERDLVSALEELETAKSAAAVSSTSPTVEAVTENRGASALFGSNMEMDKLIAAKEAEIEELTKRLEASPQFSTQASAENGDIVHDPSQAGESAESLREQIENLQKDLTEKEEHYQREILEKESQIRELNSRLEDGLGGYSLTDIHSRDAEITELQASNEEAQQWMAQAVEHHQRLSSQIESLTKEKSDLASRLAEADLDIKKSNSEIDAIANGKALELEEARAEILRQQAELDEMRNELKTVESLKLELQSAQDQVTDLQRQLEQASVDYREIETQFSQIQEENSSLRNEIGLLQSNAQNNTALYSENESLRNSNSRLQASEAELQGRLREFEKWVEMAQTKIAELLSSKNEAETQLSSLRTELIDAKNDIASARDAVEGITLEKDSMIRERNEAVGILEALRAEKEALYSQSEMQLTKSQTRVAQLTEEIATLQDTIEDLRSGRDQSIDRQNSAIEMQEKLQSLSQELADTTKARKDAESSLRDANSLANKSRIQVESLQNEINSLKTNAMAEAQAIDNASDLFALPNGVDSPSVSSGMSPSFLSEDAIAVAQQVDAMLKRREQELDEAKSTLAKDEDVVNKWEERMQNLESTINGLQKQLEEQESAANDAITQWQESCNETEEQCAALEATISTLTEERDSMSKTIVQWQEKFEAATNERDAASGVAKQWQESYEAMQKKYLNLQGEIESITNERDAFVRSISEDREKLLAAVSARNEMEVQLEATSNERNSLSTSLSQLQGEISKKEARLSELESERESILAGQDGLNAEIQRQKDEQKEKIRALTEERDLLLDTVSRLQQNLAEKEKACTALEAEVKIVTEERDSILSSLNVIEQDNNELEEEKQNLQETLSSLQESISAELKKTTDTSLQNKAIQELEMQLKEKTDELKGVREALVRDEEVVNQWEERVKELSATIIALETQLATQESAAEDAINQWQETYNQSEERCLELEEELARVENALAEARDQNRSFLAGLEGDYEDQMKELAQKLEESQIQMTRSEKERQNIQKLWSKGEITIEGLRADIAGRDEAVSSLAAEVEKLQSEIVESKEKLSVSYKIQDELDKCKTELSNLNSEFEQATRAHAIELGDLEEELEKEKTAHETRRLEAEQLRQELEDVESKSEEAINQWTARVEEMEKIISDLEAQLYQQGLDANAAISVWEEKTVELEAELDIATKLLDELRSRVQVDDALLLPSAIDDLLLRTSKEKDSEEPVRLHDFQAEILAKQNLILNMTQKHEEDQSTIEQLNLKFSAMNEAEVQMRERNQAIVAEYVEKIESLLAKQAEMTEHIANMEQRTQSISDERTNLRDALDSKSNDELEEECRRLNTYIEKLENELKESQNMVRAYITDEYTEQASDEIAHTLRKEVEHLEQQIEEYLAIISSEKSARIAAEEDAQRFRADLEALLPISNQDGSLNKVHLLSVKAAEKTKAKDRSEIESLRKSLTRALDELEVARNAERDATEKLSIVRRQASALEQEILSTKASLSFMTQTVEEMREVEETMRAEFDYRIGSLENDYNHLHRCFTDQLKGSKSEHTQALMEMDRLQQTLKESERKNATLVEAASKSNLNSNGNENLLDELSRLRIECAHFKNALGEEKSKSERHLREALAARASSAEADVIVEQELRIAAENAVRTCKAELEEVREKTAQQIVDNAREERAKVRADLESLNAEVKRLKLESRELKGNNTTLKRKLEESTATAHSEINALKEECRNAQARAHKLASEKKRTNALELEISAMRSKSNGSAGLNAFGQELPSENHEKCQRSGTQSYDIIQKQKEAIQEERGIYLELLEEHDTLLAFLAQQIVERDCLKQALLNAAGQGAIDAAIERAEFNYENALEA